MTRLAPVRPGCRLCPVADSRGSANAERLRPDRRQRLGRSLLARAPAEVQVAAAPERLALRRVRPAAPAKEKVAGQAEEAAQVPGQVMEREAGRRALSARSTSAQQQRLPLPISRSPPSPRNRSSPMPPSRTACAGATGWFRLAPKIVTSGPAVTKRSIRIRRVGTRFTSSFPQPAAPPPNCGVAMR
jgi:hypothetical protein